MFLETYNEIIRCIRARVPAINLVLESERFIDQLLPSVLSGAGAQIVTEAQISTCSGIVRGDPVVVLDSNMLSGLSISDRCVSALRAMTGISGEPCGLEKPVLEFVKKCTQVREGQTTPKVPEWMMLAELPELVNRVRETCAGALVLLLLRDTNLTTDKKLTRALLQHCAREVGATVAVVTAEPIPDPALRSCMPVIKVGHPSVSEISRTVHSRLEQVRKQLGTDTITVSDSKGTRDLAVDEVAGICGKAMAGLHMHLALNLLTMHIESGISTTDSGKKLILDIQSLSNAKADILNKEGYMELIRDLPGEDRIGGLLRLKTWIRDRARGFSNEAKAQKLATPKGIMLVGPPGTAKSMSAKMIASMFGVPLIRLDMGALFNSLLGSSERNLRNALAVADASSPCVLMLDEVA